MSAVDLASVPVAHYVNDEYVVENFVDYSVVTHANAMHAVLTARFEAGGRGPTLPVLKRIAKASLRRCSGA